MEDYYLKWIQKATEDLTVVEHELSFPKNEIPTGAVCSTIDMCWAVILNEAKRNEESLTSVATFKEILLPTRRDQNDRFGLMSLS